MSFLSTACRCKGTVRRGPPGVPATVQPSCQRRRGVWKRTGPPALDVGLPGATEVALLVVIGVAHLHRVRVEPPRPDSSSQTEAGCREELVRETGST